MKHVTVPLQKYKGQEYLARKLQFGQVDGEEDLRSGILVDYYYDILQFAVNRGIRWKEVTSSLNFATSILQSITGKYLFISSPNCGVFGLNNKQMHYQDIYI